MIIKRACLVRRHHIARRRRGRRARIETRQRVGSSAGAQHDLIGGGGRRANADGDGVGVAGERVEADRRGVRGQGLRIITHRQRIGAGCICACAIGGGVCAIGHRAIAAADGVCSIRCRSGAIDAGVGNSGIIQLTGGVGRDHIRCAVLKIPAGGEAAQRVIARRSSNHELVRAHRCCAGADSDGVCEACSCANAERHGVGVSSKRVEAEGEG